MLAQFQSLYPKGNLISELLQIFQGKYIVRASVQIEGVTRATGMAAAETIEVAEDQARIRALMVLGIASVPQESVAFSPKPISPVQINPSLQESTPSTVKNGDFGSSYWSATSNEPREAINPISTTETRSTNKNDTYKQDFSQSFSVTSYREPEFDTPIEDLAMISATELENPNLLEISPSNVTPFTPRNNNAQENVSTATATSKRKKKSEPVDLSDVIAKTDVELQRLGWTPEQGREHLIQTYGKRGRTLLTEEELHGFLKYLESQPDPLAGF